MVMSQWSRWERVGFRSLKQTLRDPCFGEAYAELFRRGQIRNIPDIYQANYTQCHVQFLEKFQVRANLIVPIIQGQQLWGLMIAHHCRGRRQWQMLEVDLLQKLSIQVAIAVHQAELCNQMRTELAERKRITEELQRTRDAALVATQAKGDFLATMSHEIRTPMNGVIGMTDLLLASNLSTEQRHYVTTISNCGKLLLTLINDILDFSKMESGQLVLEPSPFTMHACLEEVLTLFSTQVTEKGLQLDYHLSSEVPAQLVGDVTRLRQILVNLLGNAIKFTETGKITIDVTAQPVSPPQNSSQENAAQYYELQCLIVDTGVGIPADKMEHLFKPFSQLDSSIARQYGGTGLGLAICKHLCELMGGRIWVESTVGAGSKFYVTLTVPACSSPQQSLTEKRLLIASPDLDVLQTLQQTTQSWGMNVYTAQSSYEVIGILTCEAPFDLILLPQWLPQLSASQLGQSIRKRPHYQDVPLIVLKTEGKQEQGLEENDMHFADQWSFNPNQLEGLRTVLLTVLSTVSLSSRSPSQKATVITRAPAHSLKILVAEDNVVNQQLVLQWLRKMGYSAEIVGNGFQVLEALQQKSYDLILMDIQMPGMDGLSATEQICQRWPGAERPKIIAMTANAMNGDRELCLAKGMDDYISKPINVQRLAEVLEQCTSRKNN
jgi:signal transduction histidine kinase/DNA-binding response OmpR family regulator